MPNKTPQPTSVIEWEFPEYTPAIRTKKWYVLMILILLALIIYAILTDNFLFALIIVMFGIIIFINQRHEPQKIKITLSSQGIKLGEKEYPYSQLSNFWLIYNPPVVKNLYFIFKNSWRPHLSIPLTEQNPLEVRSFLRRYLPEDLEQEGEPLSDVLGRLFKIF